MRRVLLVLAILVVLAPTAPRARASDARLQTIQFPSAAMGRTMGVRVLLPDGYDDPANANRRYPVLFLVHGASGNETDWTDKGDAEAITAGADVIVVMPDGGTLGFYSDWLDGPQWESFHIGELVPWVDRTYRTLGTRAGRAVAGLSMGGYGALIYAARHPDLFVAAASFSGAADITAGDAVEPLALNTIGLAPDERWGPYASDEVVWRDHNPPDLALNLRSTKLAMYTGDGIPRQGDNPASAPLEGGIYLLNISAHGRFTSAGVVHEWHDYGPGTHEWQYWQRDLRQWLPTLMDIFADPPPPPAGFDYRTAEPAFSVWGWTFTTHRAAREFLELRNVQPSVLTAIGRGPVDVVTAPTYVPGGRYKVQPDVGLPTVVIADGSGRLAFTIDLGPNHPYQQYTPLADTAQLLSPSTYFTTRVVHITPT